MWHMQDVGWGWWLVMSLGMVAFWALVFYVILMLARGTSPRAAPAAPESASAVLRRRLAGGEISVDEYDELRRALGDGSRPSAPVGVSGPPVGSGSGGRT
jgi:putative membrane protein